MPLRPCITHVIIVIGLIRSHLLRDQILVEVVDGLRLDAIDLAERQVDAYEDLLN